jgi:ketosteroid isomerase-like protein
LNSADERRETLEVIMSEDPTAAREDVAHALRRINQAWLEGRPQEMNGLIHPEVVMVMPGFGGKARGAQAFISGFEDFCRQAKIRSFEETEHLVDVIGETAVASYSFSMVYEREGSSYRATGRDLWVFGRQAGSVGWVVVWRTMMDLSEEPA